MLMQPKFVAFFLLLTVVFVFGVNPVVGKEKAPNFTLVDINGKTFSLSDHLGKVVVLDFFATWCGPCILEIEHLQGLYEDYSAEELVILSISVDPDSDTVLGLQLFAQQNGMPWTVARDTDNVASKYAVSPIPHLVVVDAEGYERHSHLGLTAESTLRSEVDALFSEVGNGGSNGDSDAGQTDSTSTLVAAIGVCAIVLLVVVILAARKRSAQSKRARKRRSRKHKR